jgi:hypothetical protein
VRVKGAGVTEADSVATNATYQILPSLPECDRGWQPNRVAASPPSPVPGRAAGSLGSTGPPRQRFVLLFL